MVLDSDVKIVLSAPLTDILPSPAISKGIALSKMEFLRTWQLGMWRTKLTQNSKSAEVLNPVSPDWAKKNEKAQEK